MPQPHHTPATPVRPQETAVPTLPPRACLAGAGGAPRGSGPLLSPLPHAGRLPQVDDPKMQIFMMWFSLCIGTGVLACLTAALTPDGDAVSSFNVRAVAAAAEGLAGGSMMACISTAMLPEAFEEGGDMAGFATICGFIASLGVKVQFDEDHGKDEIVAFNCLPLLELSVQL